MQHTEDTAIQVCCTCMLQDGRTGISMDFIEEVRTQFSSTKVARGCLLPASRCVLVSMCHLGCRSVFLCVCPFCPGFDHCSQFSVFSGISVLRGLNMFSQVTTNMFLYSNLPGSLRTAGWHPRRPPQPLAMWSFSLEGPAWSMTDKGWAQLKCQAWTLLVEVASFTGVGRWRLLSGARCTTEPSLDG